MADRFPSIEDLDAGVQPDIQENAADSAPEDFLAREKALLGDDAVQFATSDDAAAFTDPSGDLLGEGGNTASTFESQFPDLTSADAGTGLAPGNTSITGPSVSYNSGYQAFAAEEEEPEVIKEWRERRDAQIAKRAEQFAAQREETIKEAQQNIDDFYENYNGKKEKGIAQTRKEAEEFLASREDTVSGGTSWDRIAKLVDVSGKGTKGGDLLGKSLLLELVSSELDSKTGLEKETIKEYAHRAGQGEDEVKYEGEFKVPAEFGRVGAVLVENEHHKEMFLKNIVLEGLPNGPVHIPCDSWVHSKFDNPDKRVFFTSKCYLPSQTPEGLKRLREKELESLRGNGEGERKPFERIYDYDTYNDLGDPDKSEERARPILGGKERPYPRRCRTGRARCEKDPSCEKRGKHIYMYVPRDEAFSEVKQLTFSARTLRSLLHTLIPHIGAALVDGHHGFPYFTAIDTLFNVGVALPKPENQGLFQKLMPRLVKYLSDEGDDLLRFETPAMIHRDKFSWFRDEEFSRQTLAGLNPYSIELVTEWPLKSKLDPEIYGPPESAITTQIVEREIKGIMTVKEALEGQKLFMLDYHDVLLPYVNKVRELEGKTLYGSRALFFLTEGSTLRPIAIELTRPPSGDKPQWKQVFTPSYDATSCWLWRLAKAHVCAHDAGFHQLVHHWLRTHSCTETYIIAANRQLSAMHPIYRLLRPHFRYTLEINALARQSLINANGIIEGSFSPGKYSMELSSVAYDQMWRFDMEALPADLIRRGMAVEDPTAEHGLKLTIEDYPFANDGLILWETIKQWVSDYVHRYYPEPSLVESDQELQAWWTEVRTKGHEDKKDEPWWPALNTPDDLIKILTTIIWVASGHHAAVNFGQYVYGGYFPNRPTIARTNMPTEDPSEEQFKNFLERPEIELLKCFPSQAQATKVMAVLDVLSNHSPDEEYIGEKMEASWEKDAVIKAAFERFQGRLKELEGIIDARNLDLRFANRSGAGVVPYELLKPFSKPGVTGMGVPNSISI